jgi:hypothetical protein
MSITHFSGPIAEGSGAIESITAAKTFTADDNGKTFILNATEGVAITLLSAALMGAGYRFKMIVGTAFDTSDYVITATAAIIKGGINELETDTGDDGPSTTGGTTMTLELGFEQVGDWYEFVCDGTSLFVNGQCALDGAVSFA